MLVAPELLKAIRRQLCVAHGVLDIFVPEKGLQSARMVTSVSLGKATRMSQHVGVGFHAEVRGRI